MNKRMPFKLMLALVAIIAAPINAMAYVHPDAIDGHGSNSWKGLLLLAIIALVGYAVICAIGEIVNGKKN